MAQWGDSLDFLYDIETPDFTPKALENKPDFHEWMREYLRAFKILNQTRQYGMGPNPISLVEIKAYLDLYGASDEEAFIEYILRMDAVYLDVMAKKKSAEKSTGLPDPKKVETHGRNLPNGR